MNDGPLQHEVEAILRRERARPQPERVAGEELEGATEEALEAARAERAVRNAGESLDGAGSQSGGLKSRQAVGAPGGQTEEWRWRIADTAGIDLGIAERQAPSGAGGGEVEEVTLVGFELGGRADAGAHRGELR